MFKKVMMFLMLSMVTSMAFADRLTQDVTAAFNLPDSMKNCTITFLKSDGFIPTVLYVTQCPNSKTETTLSGKNPVHVVSNSILDSDSSGDVKSSDVIELNGEKYVPLDSLGNFDLSKTVEINGKKYVKIK